MMNAKFRLAGAGLGIVFLAMLTGCATRLPSAKVDAVGPRESAGGFASKGSLRIHTATETHDDGHVFYYPHTSYSVFRMDNQLALFVANHVGITDQAVATVVLPAGHYQVVGRAEGYGLVTVPVVVYGGKTTEVYLERDGMPDSKGAAPANVVRLPGGYVIGWRAKEMPEKTSP
jgi:hypothetical protein